jgi:hypothetical protein
MKKFAYSPLGDFQMHKSELNPSSKSVPKPMKNRLYSLFTTSGSGRRLTLLEIKMAVSMICRHFDKVGTEPDKAIAVRFFFTLMPQDLMTSLRSRES